MKYKELDIRRIIGLAVLIITTILLVAGIVALIGRKAKDKAVTKEILFQGPPEAVLLYYKEVPLRSELNPSAENEDTLLVPEGQQCGYLTKDQIGGVRITPDESIWIVVTRRVGDWRSELYAPFSCFDISPTAGYPYLNRVKYHWSDLTPRSNKMSRREIDYLR